MTDALRPIGGYFELELGQGLSFPYPDLARFQSGRAAFRALLEVGKPRRVWMPRHICDAMFDPLRLAGIPWQLYDLDGNLEIAADGVEMAPDDWLLYVNYFGIGGKNVSRLLERFPKEQIVLDYSQAFFDPPRDVLATIYSPRKFFGVPDGGLLATGLMVHVPATQDAASVDRSLHLVQRLAFGPEAGYGAFQKAEAQLSDCTPRRMSDFTHRLLLAVDFERVARQRRENFFYLHRSLGTSNHLAVDPAGIDVPLCYPFITDDPSLRERLIAHRIFVPTYWADTVDRVDEAWGQKMVKDCLPLPVDQRHDSADMERIAALIRGEL